jgi:hypothetical protein
LFRFLLSFSFFSFKIQFGAFISSDDPSTIVIRSLERSVIGTAPAGQFTQFSVTPTRTRDIPSAQPAPGVPDPNNWDFTARPWYIPPTDPPGAFKWTDLYQFQASTGQISGFTLSTALEINQTRIGLIAVDFDPREIPLGKFIGEVPLTGVAFLSNLSPEGEVFATSADLLTRHKDETEEEFEERQKTRKFLVEDAVAYLKVNTDGGLQNFDSFGPERIDQPDRGDDLISAVKISAPLGLELIVGSAFEQSEVLQKIATGDVATLAGIWIVCLVLCVVTFWVRFFSFIFSIVFSFKLYVYTTLELRLKIFRRLHCCSRQDDQTLKREVSLREELDAARLERKQRFSKLCDAQRATQLARVQYTAKKGEFAAKNLAQRNIDIATTPEQLLAQIEAANSPLFPATAPAAEGGTSGLTLTVPRPGVGLSFSQEHKDEVSLIFICFLFVIFSVGTNA